jgi:hypothetical protein
MRGARTPIVIKNMVPAFANAAAEDEGIWTNGGTEVTVLGSIHQKASEDVDEGTTGQMSEERNIICRVPLSADISYGDQIIIEDFHPVMNGTYEIDALLYTRTHVRVECRRTLR